MPSLRYDFHIHSCLSPCGEEEMTPNNIVGMAQILELDAIAVADHNTAKNLPAVMALGAEAGVLVVPAIEISTAEEVHVLSLFPSLEAALEMDKLLYDALPPVKNRPDIFGRQLWMDKDDGLLGETDKLLINATALSIEQVFKEVRVRGGLPIPAHIDKNAYSVLSNLGFIPPELEAGTVEVARPPFAGAEGLKVISDSDAHALEVLAQHEAHVLDVADVTIGGVLDALR
ncbi:MAG: histidinol-phosphatase [Oscillospiraceae bacterium]|jgi:PHP family Zn ribbon phosphoesterase|nr:histidinol-phosphatase [Oscillospiraceae bacterium]